MQTIKIHNDDNAQREIDACEYKSIMRLLMRELIARVDAFEQHDCNDVSHASLISIRNACEKYVDTIERTHE